MKNKKEKPLSYVYALYDNKGRFFALWGTKQEAMDDAVGPRFRPTFVIRIYKLMPGAIWGRGG
jgi:hypothetical protein